MNVTSIPFEASESEALRYLGIPVATKYVWDFHSLCSEARRNSNPQAIYLRLAWPDAGSLLPGLHLSADIGELLAGAHGIYVMAVTLGGGIDTIIDGHMATGNYARAVSVDAIASSAAEGAMERLWRDLADLVELSKGETLGRRFSPGYGDLPLDFQRELMIALDMSAIGIAVSESSLLLPRKSLTAIAGIVRCDLRMPAQSRPDGCNKCHKTDCNYRRGGTE